MSREITKAFIMDWETMRLFRAETRVPMGRHDSLERARMHGAEFAAANWNDRRSSPPQDRAGVRSTTAPYPGRATRQVATGHESVEPALLLQLAREPHDRNQRCQRSRQAKPYACSRHTALGRPPTYIQIRMSMHLTYFARRKSRQYLTRCIYDNNKVGTTYAPLTTACNFACVHDHNKGGRL